MKHSKSPKQARQTTIDDRHDSSTGRNAISITPPAYGLDFVDRGHTATVLSPPLQLQPDLEEEELLQGKFAPVQRQPDYDEEELLQGKFAANVTPMQFQTGGEPSENRTGMPDQLKAGLEQLGGYDLSGVRVHHNSAKPAQLNALAYTQGNEIHVGPGHEEHLPHEGWHAVQQMQGRVRPTTQAKGAVINDDPALEREADLMGAEAKSIGKNRPRMMPPESFGADVGQIQQQYASKYVSPSAKTHYNDGWGDQYSITDDQTLKDSVPKSVRGKGWIDLGWYDAPNNEQDPEDRKFEKQCWIGYQDGSREEETKIYHCGPSGRRRYHD